MSNRNNDKEDEIAKAFQDPTRMLRILQEGIREALLEHKRAGNPICGSFDGKIIWIQPEDI